jgi:hypothetical protein
VSVYSEYRPSRSQCQRYTAAPAIDPQAFEPSWMVSLIVRGMPSAVPENSPKLERMSRRTISVRVRTSGPFEPSAG